jgi:hypothetical protein
MMFKIRNEKEVIAAKQKMEFLKPNPVPKHRDSGSEVWMSINPIREAVL